MAKQLTPDDALGIARSALASIEAQHGELAGKRRAAPLTGASAPEVGKIDAEIERLQHAAQTERDRIEILAEEVRKVEIQAAVKRKGATIDRLEKKLAGTVDMARELEHTIARAIDLFHKICRARVETMPVFALGDSEVAAAVNNIDGAALSASSVTALLSFELFRQGERVATTPGVPPTEPPWPRPLCPRIDLQLTPDRVRPFSAALEAASTYAVRLMREGRAPALLSSEQVSKDDRTPDQQRLEELLKKQSEQSATPPYDVDPALMREIEALTDKLQAERR
jgi:hypothetical protein